MTVKSKSPLILSSGASSFATMKLCWRLGPGGPGGRFIGETGLVLVASAALFCSDG
jgi:hypothetical protein